MFGKSVPNSTRSPRSPNRGSARSGNGSIASVNLVNAIVVSNMTRSCRSASPRKSSYSGIPRCAATNGSRGCRSNSAAIGSGPVCAPGTGPDPQWVTTGIPASVSSPHTLSSSGELGSKPPTWRWHLKTRAPWSTARVTSSIAEGSAKNVAV